MMREFHPAVQISEHQQNRTINTGSLICIYHFVLTLIILTTQTNSCKDCTLILVWFSFGLFFSHYLFKCESWLPLKQLMKKHKCGLWTHHGWPAKPFRRHHGRARQGIYVCWHTNKLPLPCECACACLRAYVRACVSQWLCVCLLYTAIY